MWQWSHDHTDLSNARAGMLMDSENFGERYISGYSNIIDSVNFNFCFFRVLLPTTARFSCHSCRCKGTRPLDDAVSICCIQYLYPNHLFCCFCLHDLLDIFPIVWHELCVIKMSVNSQL